MNNLEQLLESIKNNTSCSPYSQCLSANNGLPIPQFVNGTSFYSKYNPSRESDFFLQDKEIQESDFVIFMGFGFGYQLEKLFDFFPKKQFLVIEENLAAYAFIFSHISCNEFRNKKIIFATFDTLAETIKNYFNPLFHSKICTKTMRSWENFYHHEFSHQKEVIINALRDKILDTKTQSHFGKQWNSNFWKNLYLIKKYGDTLQKKQLEYCIDKKVVITAAGPSLDKNINQLKFLQNEIFILATDTSLPILHKHGIIPQAVITIDGQEHSVQHYYFLPQETAIFMDVCTSHNIALQGIKNKNPLFFIQNGHPLIQYFCINFQQEFFPKIECGNGTVTIAALSLAQYLGFSNITLLGADFSFPFNKAYANGSYFEDTFTLSQKQTNSFEHQQASLYLGKEKLVQENNISTTALLQNYKKSLELFIKEKNIKLTNIEQIIKNSKNRKVYSPNLPTKNQIDSFWKNYRQESTDNSFYLMTLQPLIFFYQKENPFLTSEELLAKAHIRTQTLLQGVFQKV